MLVPSPVFASHSKAPLTLNTPITEIYLTKFKFGITDEQLK